MSIAGEHEAMRTAVTLTTGSRQLGSSLVGLWAVVARATVQ
jgi:hypothetical protein